MRGPMLFTSFRACRVRNGCTIGLISRDTADVLHVRVELVADADVERQVGPDAPVVLHEQRDVVVVRVRNIQALIGLAASERHGKQQILVIHSAIAVVIEIGEVFDQLDAALAEHIQVEVAEDALPLAAALIV